MPSTSALTTAPAVPDRTSHLQAGLATAALAGTFVAGVLSAGGSVQAATLAAAVVLGAITAAALLSGCRGLLARRGARRLEDDLEALRRALPDTVARVDRDGRILGVFSPHPGRLFASREALVGTDVLDVVGAPQRAALGNAVAGTLVTGHPSALELDGQDGPVETRVVRSGEDEAILVCRSVSPERLADRERRLLAKLITELQDAVVLLDREQRILVWTGGAERVYGWKATEVIGRSVHDLLDPQPDGASLDQIADAFRTGTVCRFRSRDLRKDGLRVPTTIMLVPHEAGDAEGAQVLAICRDMSVEEEAEADQRLLSALIRQMADAVIVLDRARRIRLWTGGAEALYGWTAAEAIGRAPADLLRSALPAATEGELVSSLLAGKPVRFRSTSQRRDGASIVTAVSAAPLRDASGAVTHGLLVARDVTHETALEEEIARSRDRLACALESSGLGDWQLDVTSGAVSYDRLWPELLGYGRDEIPHTLAAWVALADPRDVGPTRAAVFEHIKGRTEAIDCEYRLRDKAGHWRWIHSRGRVTSRDAAGRALLISGTHADVTRRRDAEERVRAALAANERLVADLRGALASVKTLSGLLPVCAWCKKIRDDAGYWQRIETYLSEHSGATFTHALCPECRAREFPDDRDDA